MVSFYGEETLALRPPTKLEGRPLVYCQRLLINIVCSDPSILEAILPSTNWRHAVVTRIHLSRNGTPT